MPRNKKYNNRKPRRRRKAYRKRMPMRKAIINAGETKLQKQIYDELTHGVLNKNESHTWMSPYVRDESTTVPPVAMQFPATWNNGTSTLSNFTNFVNPGAQYNQRVGRRISAKSASIELQFGFVAAHTTLADVTYPVYASLRVIHGWCKEGCQQIEALSSDVANLYSEIPFSKYKVLSDKTYTRAVRPAVTYGTQQTVSGVASSHEIATYAPFKIKRNWYPNGKNITFTDSLTPANTTYAGWCPFLIILNPHHGTGANNLKLEFKYIKRVFAFKDA